MQYCITYIEIFAYTRVPLASDLLLFYLICTFFMLILLDLADKFICQSAHLLCTNLNLAGYKFWSQVNRLFWLILSKWKNLHPYQSWKLRSRLLIRLGCYGKIPPNSDTKQVPHPFSVSVSLSYIALLVVKKGLRVKIKDLGKDHPASNIVNWR